MRDPLHSLQPDTHAHTYTQVYVYVLPSAGQNGNELTTCTQPLNGSLAYITHTAPHSRYYYVFCVTYNQLRARNQFVITYEWYIQFNDTLHTVKCCTQASNYEHIVNNDDNAMLRVFNHTYISD